MMRISMSSGVAGTNGLQYFTIGPGFVLGGNLVAASNRLKCRGFSKSSLRMQVP